MPTGIGAKGEAGDPRAGATMMLHTGVRRWTPALDLAEQAGPPSNLAPCAAGSRYPLRSFRTLLIPKKNCYDVHMYKKLRS